MSEHAGYPLGTSDTELERLLVQTEAYAPQSRWLLDRLAIAPGAKVVDIGCGPLGILDLLSDRVGPTGEVVGLDRAARMIELGRQVLAARNLDNVRLVQGEADNTGLPREAFDFVHERTLLIDVPNPEAVVAEMVALARPGGIVALQDPDQVSWVCDPPNATWDRLIDAVEALQRQEGRDVYIGRRLHRLLIDAGLVDVQVQVHALTWRPGHPNHLLLMTVVEHLRDQILESGIYGEDNLDGDLGVLRVHLERPDSLTVQPLICQAWGRKPG
jgi:SAM-dependent methyltransferase